MNNSGPLSCPTLALLCAGVIAFAQPVSASTIEVRAGESLQAAIDAAQPGDIILLERGATFVGNFVLPVKAGSDFITIRTAGDSGFPAAGSRIQPSHAPLLAKLRSGNSAAALRTAPGAHHWRLMLLEFRANFDGFGDIIQLGDGSSEQNEPAEVPYEIELDRLFIHGDPELGQKRGIALNAAAVTIRNSYISDIKAVGLDTQAIGGWNGPGPYVIENNYLEAAGENLLIGGADPAIPNLVAENIVVRYNHFSRPLSWMDPVLGTPADVSATAAQGGALAAGTYSYKVVARRVLQSGLVTRSTPSALATSTTTTGAVRLAWSPVAGATEYRVYGRTSAGLTRYWTVTDTAFIDTGTTGQAGTAPTTPGAKWLVKNLFELKSARGVLVEYNVFENNWAHGQVGYAILFTPRNQNGGCPWCVVEQVTFQYNVVRNVAGGINLSGYDSPNPSLQTNQIRIRHNLFYRVTSTLGGTGWFMLVGDEPRDIIVDHNTIDADGSTVLYAYGGTASAPRQITGFQFTNNATRHSTYGINGADSAFGFPALTTFFPGALVTGNWLQGGPAARYPEGNFFAGAFAEGFVDAAAADYRAAAGGPLAGRASDGTDIGADVATLLRRTATVSAPAATPLARPRNLRILK